MSGGRRSAGLKQQARRAVTGLAATPIIPRPPPPSLSPAPITPMMTPLFTDCGQTLAVSATQTNGPIQQSGCIALERPSEISPALLQTARPDGILSVSSGSRRHSRGEDCATLCLRSETSRRIRSSVNVKISRCLQIWSTPPRNVAVCHCTESHRSFDQCRRAGIDMKLLHLATGQWQASR